jgi:polyisoprenoid-binding protein YceI
MKDGVPTQGSFVLNMTNFSLNGSDRAREDIMENMFQVGTYPESTLVVTSVESVSDNPHQFTVAADLTIKDVTNEVTFVTTFTPDRRSATASFSIDRTRRGLVYQSASVFSGLGDKAINDMIEFNIDLVLE